jgi:hypothetical protein
MGGGAGISIEVELNQFSVTRSKNNRCHFKVLEQPVVGRWHAVGYDDGCRDLRGDLLKATVSINDIHPSEAGFLKENGLRPGDTLYAWIPEKQWPKKMLWRGWTRGKWQDAFPLQIPFELDIEAFGTTTAVLTIEPANPEEFNAMWEDVFDFEAQEDEPEEGQDPLPMELVSDFHWQDVKGNYCVSGA